jgi:hypothetical protein
MENFIDTCEEIFKKIKQNRSIQECLNCVTDVSNDDALWFIYYMFFAIHNPKMEEYIQKKVSIDIETDNAAGTDTAAAADASQRQQAYRDIMNNMLKRRHHTSTIVFQLYTHAYTNQGNVTHVYPKYKNDTSKKLIKSYQSNHLKTTAVLLRRAVTSASASASSPVILPPHLNTFLEYVITTAPTTASASTAEAILNKINTYISYKRKDIILLALLCYMKIDEDDINKKNIFIAATASATASATATAANELEIPSAECVASDTVYDEKYKYLYT